MADDAAGPFVAMVNRGAATGFAYSACLVKSQKSRSSEQDIQEIAITTNLTPRWRTA